MSEQYKGYPIKIDGASIVEDVFWKSDSTLNYEATVRAVLDKLTAKTGGVGNVVLNALPKGKDIVIVPYVNRGAGACNATAADATIIEAGKARVRFTPTMWQSGGVCLATPEFAPGVGMGDDEVLLHELLHAFRKVRGTFNNIALKKPDKAYDNIEELFAILISNIYISENGKTKLRKDHAGFAELPAKWATSETFMRDPDFFHWIEYFWLTEKPLTASLAASSAPFNPFRAYKAHIDAQEAAMASGW